MYEVPLLTAKECEELVKAAGAAMNTPGFVPTRTRHDPSTEVPLEDMSSEVRNKKSRLLAF